MQLYDYLCTNCEEIFEKLNTVDKRQTTECPTCGGKAKQLLCAPTIKLDGTDPGFPSAYEAWAKKHEKAGRKARLDSYNQ